MKPSAFLRTLSSKLSRTPSSSSSVVPWPPVRTAFDRWLASELDGLRLGSCTSAAWLSRAVDVTIAVQKLVATTNQRPGPVDRRAADDHLEDLIEFLDALEGIRERLQVISKYAASTSIALHCLEGQHEPCDTVVRRARAELSRCAAAMESRCAELERYGSNLRNLGEKINAPLTGTPSSEFHQMLTASRAVAVLFLGMLGAAVLFKSPRAGLIPLPHHEPRRSSSWNTALEELSKEAKEEYEKKRRRRRRRRRRGGVMVLDELDAVASDGKRVRELLRCGRGRGELKEAAWLLRKRSGELEDKMRTLEEKVDELYTQFLGIRVAFLGMHCSQTSNSVCTKE